MKSISPQLKTGLLSAAALLAGLFISSFLYLRRQSASASFEPLEDAPREPLFSFPLESLITSSHDRHPEQSDDPIVSGNNTVPYSGIVLREDNHFPLPSTTLTFQWAPRLSESIFDQTYSIVTNEHGTFSLALDNGRYRVTLQPPLPYIYQEGFVDITPPMEFVAPLGLTLEGLVQDSIGNPLAGAEVFLLDPHRRHEILVSHHFDKPIMTDAFGFYRVEGVPRYVTGSFDESFLQQKELQPFKGGGHLLGSSETYRILLSFLWLECS